LLYIIDLLIVKRYDQNIYGSFKGMNKSLCIFVRDSLITNMFCLKLVEKLKIILTATNSIPNGIFTANNRR